jgi:CRISPR-associated exonuclease Cas4
MMNVTIENGTIFHGKTRNRLNVEFDESLKEETFTLAQEFHKLVDSRETPKSKYSKKCDNCSFKELYLPEILLDKKNT